MIKVCYQWWMNVRNTRVKHTHNPEQSLATFSHDQSISNKVMVGD